MPRRAVPRVIAVAALLACVAVAHAQVVDEPLGARYSLGMTLWHMGHSAAMIREFHDFARAEHVAPGDLLPTRDLTCPEATQQILLDPELLPADQLAGWQANGECVVSGATDAGPTLAFPFSVPRAGLYRIWVRYLANLDSRAVTSLSLYRAGHEEQGPICQPDEFYAEPPAAAGPAWHDLLVDLEAGDYTVKLGHVTRWWHGPGGYDLRQVDCLYLTDALWADPPTADALQTLRAATPPEGIQRTAAAPLTAADRDLWQWWRIRPLSWEDAARYPGLFRLSRRFWQQRIDALAQADYAEDKLPDYRAPERQVVFNETWNMVANPVRARRQIDILQADIRREPLPYHYVWHDIAGNVPDLTAPEHPATYGGWTFEQGCLFAGWGTPTGTVATEVPVQHPGRYTVWVLSEGTNLNYTAPWFGTVSVAGKEQFRYHHEGQIPSLWMKMGEAVVDEPGNVKVEFTLDDFGFGETYRRVYTLFLVDDPAFVPTGTVRPPWTLEMYRQRAAKAGAALTDRCMLWVPADPYLPLSQEVWADRTTEGRSWPEQPVTGPIAEHSLTMASDTCRAVQVCLRNLTDEPLTFTVKPGPMNLGLRRYPDALTWRVVAFAPSGPERQQWTPFFLLRRPDITVPPFSAAALWLTMDSHGLAPGDYAGRVALTAKGLPTYEVKLQARVSPIAPTPYQPILVDGYTQPHEGEPYLRDFVDHGLKLWRGMMSKADMTRWGMRQQAINMSTGEDIAAAKALGLECTDWFTVIGDEPTGKTEAELRPFLDVAKTLKAADPEVRIPFNPGEAATVPTFETLAPYCDFWLPYSLHLSENWGGPQKWAIYKAKPWMWYTTPCLWDKSPSLPNSIYNQIRQVPSQTGRCVGTAFFALNYPWRDQWDAGYEHIPDASTMGAVISRHGPVATRTWEAIREADQHADLAMMVRERSGAAVFEDVTDPEIQRLVRDGSVPELMNWLERYP